MLWVTLLLRQCGNHPVLDGRCRSGYRPASCFTEAETNGKKDTADIGGMVEQDVAGLLALMYDTWNQVFRQTLGPAERGLVGELRGHRTEWTHQEPFSTGDAYRALDSIHRLLSSVSAPQDRDIETMKRGCTRPLQRYGDRGRTLGPQAASPPPSRCRWRLDRRPPGSVFRSRRGPLHRGLPSGGPTVEQCDRSS